MLRRGFTNDLPSPAAHAHAPLGSFSLCSTEMRLASPGTKGISHLADSQVSEASGPGAPGSPPPARGSASLRGAPQLCCEPGLPSGRAGGGQDVCQPPALQRGLEGCGGRGAGAARSPLPARLGFPAGCAAPAPSAARGEAGLPKRPDIIGSI